MSRISDKSMAMYGAMRGRFGGLGWWPGDGVLEICVGAILTQNTNWTNVEKAIANLLADRCMSISAIHAKTPAELAELIRPAGYFNVKAGRLKNFIDFVRAGFGDDIEAFLGRPIEVLRRELLSVNGVGPETADSMILYAAGKATFVVDAYTRRILSRHGLIDGWEDYETIRTMFESSLPRKVKLWNDYHAQLVAVGKNYCKPKPRCKGCPLARFKRAANH